MKQKTGLQMSSSLPVMILLNLSGGTQDACSYFYVITSLPMHRQEILF
nr:MULTISPECIES: hypothetical protein [unclassified Clostridium]